MTGTTNDTIDRTEAAADDYSVHKQKPSLKEKHSERLTKLLAFDSELSRKWAVESPVIGTDEVGRGCLAGPVVAAALILPPIEPGSAAWSSLTALNDSKKLSASRRQELANVLKDISIYAIGEASVEEIDRINILQASLLAMRRALQKLAPQPDSLLLIDGQQKIPQIKHRQITVVQGDGLSASIAAASIIAKVYRDQLMHRLSEEHPQYLWHSNKGYGSADHRQAISEHGLSIWHRKSFCSGLKEVAGKQLSLT